MKTDVNATFTAVFTPDTDPSDTAWVDIAGHRHLLRPYKLTVKVFLSYAEDEGWKVDRRSSELFYSHVKKDGATGKVQSHTWLYGKSTEQFADFITAAELSAMEQFEVS
jgi:hypothetical protein